MRTGPLDGAPEVHSVLLRYVPWTAGPTSASYEARSARVKMPPASWTVLTIDSAISPWCLFHRQLYKQRGEERWLTR